jgi:predicted DNA-binding transcriptional regulator YafY
VPIESIDHAAREMLRLGADAEVVEPGALRSRMAQAAQQMLALYV